MSRQSRLFYHGCLFNSPPLVTPIKFVMPHDRSCRHYYNRDPSAPTTITNTRHVPPQGRHISSPHFMQGPLIPEASIPAPF